MYSATGDKDGDRFENNAPRGNPQMYLKGNNLYDESQPDLLDPLRQPNVSTTPSDVMSLLLLSNALEEHIKYQNADNSTYQSSSSPHDNSK